MPAADLQSPILVIFITMYFNNFEHLIRWLLKKTIYIFIFLLVAKLVPAQQPAFDFVFADPVFQNYTMKNGLVSNYCYDVLQDKRGYIWVATLNGLSRFNGRQWQSFQQQNKKPGYSLPANWVIDVDEDAVGDIWINTDRGIAKYVYKNDSVVFFRQPVKGWGKICCSSAKELFVSSWNGIGKYRQSGDSLAELQQYPETMRNSFPQLFKDAGGNVWACPEDNPSLVKITPATKQLNYYKTITLSGRPQQVIVNSIGAYAKDTLLLGTKANGLLKYCTLNNTAVTFLNVDDEVSCCLKYTLRNEQFIIAGTKNKGLLVLRLKNNRLFQYRNDHNDPNSILSDYITAVFSDNNEGIWIATSKGLSFFHPSLQTNKYYYFYNDPLIPPGVLINCVYKISNDKFLTGTDNNGLFLYDAALKSSRRVNIPGHKQVRIASFLKSGPDNVLVATGKGLFSYNIRSGLCTEKKIDGEPFRYPMLRVTWLGDSLLGLCTYKGLMVYNVRNRRVLYSELDKNKTENERLFCKDAFLNGNELWILRFFNGYELHDLESKTSVDYTPGEFDSKPIDYHNMVSDNGALYISTSAGIIVQQLSGSREVHVLKTAQGLQGDEVENVLCLNHRLYYTTPDGLYSYDPGTTKSKRILNYENYAQKWFNQLTLFPDSSLLYTISDYFIVNNPFLDFNNKKHPALETEQILVNGKPYRGNIHELPLAYNENNVTIRLAGLVYPESEKNTWYYQLNAPDTLLHSTADGEIILNNLPPDDYELTVYAVNNEGIQSPVSKIMQLHIRKPFYNTGWFYALIAGVLLSVSYLFFRYRKAQQEELMRIRNQISRDLHDELGANVSSIHIMSQMLLAKQPGLDNPVLSNISKYSVQISDTINDIIWNVNPKFDSVEELIKKMTRYASESMEAAQLNYTIDVPALPVKAELENQFKYHLYLLFKESVNNAAKYSQAQLVKVAIRYTDNVFSFEVEDNGIGFNPVDIEKGNGLNNMQARAKVMKATLEIRSELTKGTLIKLVIKLK